MPTQAEQGEKEVNPVSSEPQNVLNKAFRKVKPVRADFETFKTQLEHLLKSVEPAESEEFHKNLITHFLKNTYYDGHFVNTKHRNDLVIHEGDTAATPVGVILETKKPGNKGEMLARHDPNRKALHELVLYYLRERVTNSNLGLKHLIVTDTHEWFIFDANEFEKTFLENKAFVKTYEDFAAGRLSGTKTDFFYTSVAKPYIAQLDKPLHFTFVDLREYLSPDNPNGVPDEKKLITLYKLFSPEHLLKLPFANDSNTLDQGFYAELLHIVGLTEEKVGGKKLIVRQEQRGDASIIENTVIQLDNQDKLSRVAQPDKYGDSREDRLFNVALELAITWVNRVLFLKLLESQLLSYHKHQENVRGDYAFLNTERLKDYDELNTLFFGVLAKPVSERHASVAAYENVPYLNSSLFELTELEQRTLTISALRDNRELELYSGTVLKDANGKKRSGKLNTLAYLFEFLDAYDFSSEGSEAVQEDDKRLINASVLGLIFEKINGYKDGSFFTPGFITMYMCRETIRRAALQKFNNVKGWNCKTVAELYNKIDDKLEANRIIDSLKICDPAVGSGHFLVSALNEIIALKSELDILMDSGGKMLRDYTLEVSNDELVVTGEDGELFEYNPKNAESRRVQKTLFHEKQTLIENCLFGVDINPNSVKICRLRLWIELLKNAYYKADGGLETLPNIDINIKTGNSLISRYSLDVDLKQALHKSGLSVEDYRNAVDTYRNATTKDEKRDMERLIASIKNNFRSEIANNDPKVIKLENLSVKLASLKQAQLFEESAAQQKEREKLESEVGKLSAEIEAIKNNKIFENAFEWRFEFPEVLGDDGEFVGFDVILGNPPYGVSFTEQQKRQFGEVFETFTWRGESYLLFIEKAVGLLKEKGALTYIVPDTYLNLDFTGSLREYLLKNTRVEEIFALPRNVFQEATVDTNILFVKKEIKRSDKIDNFFDVRIRLFRKATEKFDMFDPDDSFTVNTKSWIEQNSFLIYTLPHELDIIAKVSEANPRLADIATMFYGIKAYQVGKGVPLQTAKIRDEKPFTSEIQKNSNFLPFFTGKDIGRYELLWKNNSWLDYGNWLAEPRNPGIFAGEKILIRKIVGETLVATYVPNTSYCNTLLYVLNVNHDQKESYSYIVGVLNSKFIGWYFRKKFQISHEDTFPQIMIGDILNFPIRTIDFSNPADRAAHDRMTGMVDTMLELHKQKADASGDALTSLETRIAELDAAIDALVYELYDLSEEEIGVLEGAVAG